MSTKNLKQKIEDTQKKISKLQSQLEKDGEKLFKEGCKEIFKKNKDFESFSWPQYTMYWNDGDPTEFHVYSDMIYINEEEESVYVYELENTYKSLLNKEKSIKDLEKEIKKLESNKKDNEWKIKRNKDLIEELNTLNLEEVEKRLNFLKDIEEIMSVVDKSTFENMFGDHVKVTVFKDQIKTETYEHD
jgi:hypothetical protein